MGDEKIWLEHSVCLKQFSSINKAVYHYHLSPYIPVPVPVLTTHMTNDML